MTVETIPMQAIAATDQAAGPAGMMLVERPELAGVVTALGYGTTGLSVGQRVFGPTDWHRDGTLAAP
jgi:NADPH:quinone reductase-like Zn-dependent oxidoreductase